MDFLIHLFEPDEEFVDKLKKTAGIVCWFSTPARAPEQLESDRFLEIDHQT
ncbi:hypothetical protein [Pararhodobacter sp. CCB-MM2]|uniref:hypothetical protein n=1 Tax=Pararhodobacter sp. CCB-MM2 TaxID=1786003 RepID=UPI001F16C596|nr:hypothetical protein [Pararhodobacter sp. CCB-MM2]